MEEKNKVQSLLTSRRFWVAAAGLAAVVSEDIFGAVTVMHIEIQNCHPLQTILFQGMGSTHGYIIEVTEAHGPVVFSMMTRGAY